MVSCSHAPYEKITDGLIVPDTLPSNTELKIIEENDAVVLQTANLQARIMLNTGEVSYDGNECIVDLSAR
ncbi:MAG: hypothetical protein PHD61_07750 [Bacteroidales bacterium]|nr:hypothetical protein [Lentimicrobiaceae bacterium]MDD5695184.1 hypothetical protein [Bacteroidales bacterium]